ncbi:MAG TPA: SDR family NAD(P)-dependent oxidoreductase [Burkholderiales bacterium]
MKDLRGRTAAITGAGSGLGRAMALAFAAEGMDLALADVDQAGLEETARNIKTKVFTMKVDVSRESDVQAFCDRIEKPFLVCNNAGVSPLGAVWESSVGDWQWILGVNLWGAIHGVRAFAPRLIAQNEGHIVNTASVAGLISPPGSGAYNVTKHAVVALSESLHHDLHERNSAVGVSVLCPAYVPTGISSSERNRPAGLSMGAKSEITKAKEANLKKAVASGRLTADDVANAVVKAVKDDRFYILTHPRIKGAIESRMRDILDERAPRDPLKLGG